MITLCLSTQTAPYNSHRRHCTADRTIQRSLNSCQKPVTDPCTAAGDVTESSTIFFLGSSFFFFFGTRKTCSSRKLSFPLYCFKTEGNHAGFRLLCLKCNPCWFYTCIRRPYRHFPFVRLQAEAWGRERPRCREVVHNILTKT